jgi:hypothetical protein
MCVSICIVYVDWQWVFFNVKFGCKTDTNLRVEGGNLLLRGSEGDRLALVVHLHIVGDVRRRKQDAVVDEGFPLDILFFLVLQTVPPLVGALWLWESRGGLKQK